ncbi:MAG: GspH/FimT family pseudopilin [Candidatus Rokuibacteriota bacterium]
MRGKRGVALVELTIGLCILAVTFGWAIPLLGGALDAFRVEGAVADVYGAVHLTKSQARMTGVMHALVIDPGGRAFRVVEDPTGAARTVVGPHTLVDGVVASPNITIRFSPKGFAVPFGTITVSAGASSRRVIVNILGRVRVA